MGVAVLRSATAVAFLMLLLVSSTPTSTLPFLAAAATAVTGLHRVWLPRLTCKYDFDANPTMLVKFPCREIVEAMASASPHIQRYLGLTDSQLQAKYHHVNLTMVVADDVKAARTLGNHIRLKAQNLLNLDYAYPCERSTFLNHLIYREMTHVWQASARNNTGPGGKTFFHGTAVFLALAAGHNPSILCSPPSTEPINMTEWRKGDCTTAQFMGFLSTRFPCFVADLNSLLEGEPYHDGLFRMLTGKSPNDAWSEYVTEYRAGRYRPQWPLNDTCHPNPTGNNIIDATRGDVGIITATDTGNNIIGATDGDVGIITTTTGSNQIVFL